MTAPGNDTGNGDNGTHGATQRDRETAEAVLRGDIAYHVVRDAIAAALAAERQRALAPLLELADELDSGGDVYGRAAARAIRRAAESAQ